MPLFSVDETRCKRDGFCVAECPAKIIEMTTKDAVPTPIQGAEELCINCGHCAAVCPHEALSLKTMGIADCPPVRREIMPHQEQVELFLKARRSTRTYKKQSVDRPTLEKLIDVARYAPSGHNLQPVNWLVIEDTEKLRALAGLVVDWMREVMEHHPVLAQSMHFERVVSAWEKGQDRIMRGAPHLIVAHGSKTLPPAQAACIIALTYLELAAASMGLGACWAGYFNAAANAHEPTIKALGLPEGHQCFGGMMVGYPVYHYHRIPLRNEARVSWR